MYYESNIEQDLIDYLESVNQSENYNGGTTTWSNIIKHYQEDRYAIIAHPRYESNLATLDNLEGWYEPINDLI